MTELNGEAEMNIHRESGGVLANMPCEVRSRTTVASVLLGMAMLVPLLADAATFVMPAGTNYFANHLFSSYVGAAGAAANSGQLSPLHTFTATQVGTGTGVGQIAQFTPGNLPAGSSYPATAPMMGELSTTSLGVGGIVRYTFNQALPVGTHVYLQDLDQGETATLAFQTCAGVTINPSGFDYLRVSTLYTPNAVFGAANVVLSDTTGNVNRPEALAAIIIRDPNVCRIQYTGTLAGGTFETYFSLPPTDLSVTKSLATPNPLLQAGPVSWTVTITNTSPATGIAGLANPARAYGLSMADTVNTSVTGLTAAITSPGGTTGGSCTVGAGNAVSCGGFSSLAAGSSIVVTLGGTLSGSYASTTLANTATVSHTTPNDTNPGNNTATSTTPVSTQTSFGSCDGRMYLDQTNAGATLSTLYNVTYPSTPFTYTSLGAGSPRNGIGYNPLDNFIYGIEWGGFSGNELIRIGTNGSSVNLGAVTNLPATNYNNGAFSIAGDYYLTSGFGGTALYRIDIASRVATTITMSQSITVSDLAWHNGRLYGIDSTLGRLVSIDAVTGAVTVIGSSTPVNNAIAMWGFTNGLLATGGGAIYSIDPATGAATLLSTAPASSNADGANCPGAPIQFNADLSVTKTNTPASGPNDLPSDRYTPGETRTYSIVVTNGSTSFGAQNITISDPIPAGVDAGTVSWTCSATSGGARCGAASGSGALNDTGLDLPAGAVATYLVTMSVLPTSTGSLTNTVTITPPSTINDANSANNTASDVDVAVARVTINKVSVGGVGAFGFTGSNGIAAQTLTTTTAGTPVSGTPQLLTTLGASTTITEGAPPTGYVLTGISCTGLSGGTATPNLATRTVTLNAAATAAGADITCTFTNTLTQPALTITKASNGPWTVGQPGATYTLNVGNAGNLATSGTITVRDQLPAGIGIRPATGFTAATGWTCSYSDEAAQSATTIVPNTGMLVTCTSNTAIAAGSTVALTIPVVVTSASPASVTNYASIGGGGDPFNSGAAPTAGAACTDSTHCASATTSVAPSPPAPATCNAAAGAPVNLFQTAPFQSNFFTDNTTETRTATLIATAGNYRVGTGTGGRFIIDMNWRWSPGFPLPSNAATMTLRVNGTNYATLTTQAGYPGYATLVSQGGATLFGGATTIETNRTSPENIWVTLPASVTTISSVQMFYTAGATADDFFFSSPSVYGCNTMSDLSIVKSNASTTYTPGSTGFYSLTVRNDGIDNVTGAVVNDTLPAGISLNGTVTCAVSGGGSCGSNTGTAPTITLLLNLDVGAVATITIPVAYASVP